MSTIKVNIVSAEKELYNDEALLVIVPGELGELGIKPKHSPLLTRLKAGEIRIKKEDQNDKIFVSGGFLEVQPDLVTVLADTAIRTVDMDKVAILEAKRIAEEFLINNKSNIDYAQVQAELAVAVAQLAFLKKVRCG